MSVCLSAAGPPPEINRTTSCRYSAKSKRTLVVKGHSSAAFSPQTIQEHPKDNAVVTVAVVTVAVVTVLWFRAVTGAYFFA